MPPSVDLPAKANVVDSRAWWGVVSLLREEPTLKELPFFHVLGLASENGKKRSWDLLSQGGRYRLRVVEWSFKGGREPVACVNSSSSPDLLVLEAASNVIVGPYDVVDFDFVATKQGKGKLTIALTTEGISGEKPRDKWLQSFHTAIPIRVIPSWWRLLARLSLALTGASLYLWVGPKSGPSQNAVQFAGLLIFVVAMGSLGEKAVSAGKDVRELGKKIGE